MRAKKSIKEIKAQLSANRKKLDELNHPNRHKSLSKLNKHRLKEQILEEKQQIKEIEIQETEQETKDIKKENHQLNLALTDLKKKVKRKKHNHHSTIIAFIVLPMVMSILLLLLTLWLFVNMQLNQSAAIVASLADPKQRAILKGQGLLKESDETTQIPDNLLGNLPSGFSVIDSEDTNKSSNKASDIDISDGDDSETPSTLEGRVKMIAEFMKKNTTATPEQVAGMAGNFAAESGIKSKRFESDQFSKATWEQAVKSHTNPSVIAPNSLSYYQQPGYSNGHGGYSMGIGLAQWTATRGYALVEAAGRDPKKAASELFQLKFFITKDSIKFRGDKNDYRWAAGKNNVSVATSLFMHKIEIPGENNEPARQAAARKWYPQIKKWMAAV